MPTPSKHQPWLIQLDRLQPGQSFSFSERDAERIGSSLNSMRKILWLHAKKAGKHVWFTGRAIEGEGQAYDVHAPESEDAPRRRPSLVALLAQLEALAIHETVFLSQADVTSSDLTRLRRLIREGLPFRIRPQRKNGETGWKIERVASADAPLTGPGAPLGSSKYADLEAKIEALAQEGDKFATPRKKALAIRGQLSRMAQRHGFWLTFTPHEKDDTKIWVVRRDEHQWPRPSTLRPYIDQFLALGLNGHYEVAEAEIERLGHKVATVNARLYNEAKKVGKKVSFRQHPGKDGVYVVTRTA